MVAPDRGMVEPGAVVEPRAGARDNL